MKKPPFGKGGPGLGVMIEVGKKKPPMEDDEPEKGMHDTPDDDAVAEHGVGEHADDEGDYSPEDGGDEDDRALNEGETHAASALIDAVSGGDPGAVVSAFKSLYTACHLRAKDEDEG